EGERGWKLNGRFQRLSAGFIARLDGRLLGFSGEADHVFPPAEVRRLRDSFDRHDKSYTIKVYPGAPHGWLNDTMPGRYRRDAAEAAWALQLAFLNNVFHGRYDHSRRVQVYESEHAVDYDFSKNVRLA